MSTNSIIQEYNHLIDVDSGSVPKLLLDEDALTDRIQEWLETPEGTIADLPAWGHNLKVFQFEPLGVDFDVMIEMSIMEKLPLDVDNLDLKGVAVRRVEIDLCTILIRFQLGEYRNTVRL